MRPPSKPDLGQDTRAHCGCAQRLSQAPLHWACSDHERAPRSRPIPAPAPRLRPGLAPPLCAVASAGRPFPHGRAQSPPSPRPPHFGPAQARPIPALAQPHVQRPRLLPRPPRPGPALAPPPRGTARCLCRSSQLLRVLVGCNLVSEWPCSRHRGAVRRESAGVWSPWGRRSPEWAQPALVLTRSPSCTHVPSQVCPAGLGRVGRVAQRWRGWPGASWLPHHTTAGQGGHPGQDPPAFRC